VQVSVSPRCGEWECEEEAAVPEAEERADGGEGGGAGAEVRLRVRLHHPAVHRHEFVGEWRLQRHGERARVAAVVDIVQH